MSSFICFLDCLLICDLFFVFIAFFSQSRHLCVVTTTYYTCLSYLQAQTSLLHPNSSRNETQKNVLTRMGVVSVDPVASIGGWKESEECWQSITWCCWRLAVLAGEVKCITCDRIWQQFSAVCLVYTDTLLLGFLEHYTSTAVEQNAYPGHQLAMLLMSPG